MNRLKPNESEKEIGFKLRLFAAFWFALAASLPVTFFLLLFGRLGFMSGGIYGSIWFYSGLPVSAAALSGFIWGTEILDPWLIDTPFQAVERGLKVSFVSYLIFISAVSAVMGLFFGESSIILRLSGTIITFFYFGLLGLLFVGWLVFIAGSLAGWTLFHLSRLSCFESTLFDTKRIEKKALRKMILVAVIIFFAASVPATIIFRADNQRKQTEESNKRIKSELIWASSDGKTEKLESLLANGADVNVKNNAGESLIVWAARSRDLQAAKAVEVLLNHGADPNARGDNNITPLLWATSNNNLQMVKTLVARGANVNLANKDGYTPLMNAEMAENTEMAKFLFENGADINAGNRQDGKTVLSAVLLGRERVKRWNMEFANTNPALSEGKKGSSEDIIQFLISRGAVQ